MATRPILFLLFISIVAGLVCLLKIWAGDTIKHHAETALNGKGVQIKIDSFSFNPFHGFSANNASLSLVSGKRHFNAHVKCLTFALSTRQLLLGRIFISKVWLNNASLNIPLSDTEKSVTIHNINARILLQPDHVRLSVAEFTFENIQFSVSGSFCHPYLLHSVANTLEKQQPHWEMIEYIVKELGKVRYLDKLACADIVFESDLATRTLQIYRLTVHAKNIQYHNIVLQELELGARYANGTLEVCKLYVRDAEGTLEGTGAANFLISKGQFAISSSLNLKPFLKEYISLSHNGDLKFDMKKLRIGASSQIDLTTRLTWKEAGLQYSIFGSAAIQKCSYGESFLQYVELSFFADNRKWFIRNLLIQSYSGVLQADILGSKEHLQIQLNSTLNPKDISDCFNLKIRSFLDHIKFLDTPRISLKLDGPKLTCLSGQGKLSLGRTSIRGVWMDFARSALEIGPQSVSCRNFKVKCKDGIGSGSITYDFGRQQVRLHNITSTLSPQDVMLWVSPSLAQIVSPYKFHSPPTIQAEGLLYLAHPHLNKLSVKIYSQSGLDYDLYKRTLCFGATQATVYVNGEQIRVHIPSAALFYGSIALMADVFLHTPQPIFELSIYLSHVEFSHLTKLFFGYTKSNGFLTGNYHFQAQVGKEGMLGKGCIRIEQGNVLSIPFLGSLSLILNQMIPGTGYEPVQTAYTSFQVENQKVSTNNLQVIGLGFSLLGYGDIDFFTGKMDITVRVNAPGFPGLVLLPVSKLLEFEAKGTLSKPRWKLKRLKPLIQF